MKKRWFIVLAMLAMPAVAQVSVAVAQVPAAVAQVPAVPVEPATPPVAKLFRNRVAGIQLLPPAGGTIIRQLDSNEIVRFVYSDKSWDIRVKPVPLHSSMALADVLRLIAGQLVQSNASAEILSTREAKIGGNDVGLLEARYNSGTDRVFAQQALIRSDDERYFLIQMGSPTLEAKGGTAVSIADKLEADARTAFSAILPTVKLLDRSELRLEQEHRLANTRGLWVLLDRNRITQALIPEHFMRLVRDGKDVGFVQVDERVTTHFGREGVEVIVRSKLVRSPDDEAADHAKATVSLAARPDPSAVVVPLQPAQKLDTASVKPTDLYTLSTFFFTFERAPGFATSHEDWETLAQVNELKKDQVDERGTADIVMHRMLDRQKLSQSLRVPATSPATHADDNPPVLERDDFLLEVSQDLRNRRAPTIDEKLLWFYLPQGLGQLLPRVVPLDDHKQYMFASFVSAQHKVMGRYVDVDPATEIELGGKQEHAVPVSDRIGVDGIPVIHYMSPSGEWLGSIGEEGRMLVLPSSEKQLQGIWPHFIASVPPSPVEDATPARPAPRRVNSAGSAESQPDGVERR